jgi:hypothetical protein
MRCSPGANEKDHYESAKEVAAPHIRSKMLAADEEQCNTSVKIGVMKANAAHLPPAFLPAQDGGWR